MTGAPTQRERALRLLQKQGMVRLAEFGAAGITAATIVRMEKAGEVDRIGRGLYRLAGQSADANHDLALVAKLVPGSVVCLVSALAFHELTDTIPSRIWIAIGSKDRKPVVTQPALQIVRFAPEMLRTGIALMPGGAPRHHARRGAGGRVGGLREVARSRQATPATPE